ncbi:MAG: class I SAM-dependent methyltransferase family protein [Promethearchaeota archaeon]
MNKKDINKKAEIRFIKLRRKDSQYFIQKVKDNFKLETIIDKKYKVMHENNYALFPLVENKELISELIKFINNFIPFEIITKVGIKNQNYKFRTLDEALVGKIPHDYLFLVPKSYDIIGDIAILEFKEVNSIDKNEIEEFKHLISQAVVQVNKNVRTVYEKKSEVKGAYRLREFTFLIGENKSETIHKENNCVFKLDIKHTYFSPRLVFERRRVSKSNIQKNEVIIDMFSGVGPFSLQIARLNDVEIHAFDVNPQAYDYLKINIGLNKLVGKIIPYNMDIKDLLNPVNQLGRKLQNTVDRIIMNLPRNSIDFANVACFLMKKSGGILHLYNIFEKPNSTTKALNIIKKELIELKWEIEKVVVSKIVKSHSPKADLVVNDLKIKYSN